MDILEEMFGNANENDDNSEPVTPDTVETGESLQDVMESPDEETNTPPPSEDTELENLVNEENSGTEYEVMKHMKYFFRPEKRFSDQ